MRGTARQRGYDRDWERVRAEFVKANPVCCVPDCGKPTTDVDHIVSVREAPHRRLDPTNFRPFCHAHHSQRTARDQVRRG
ncbi:HNH endonuclease signature motif containing protein [Azospirillum sp. sgz301742]